MSEALESKKDAEELKKKAEATVGDLEAKLKEKDEKTVVEVERDVLRERKIELEDEVQKCKGALAEYFDDGFERAREQAQHFYPEGDFSLPFSGIKTYTIIIIHSFLRSHDFSKCFC